MRFAALFLGVWFLSSSGATAATLWHCQNTCYRYPNGSRPVPDPNDFPFYGAAEDRIIPAEEITFCADTPASLQQSASAECARLHPSSDGEPVAAMIDLFPGTLAGNCRDFGEPCTGLGVKRVNYEILVACVRNDDPKEFLPLRLNYCGANNWEALVQGTIAYNQSGTACPKGYSLPPPTSYDFVAIPLYERGVATDHECP